MSSADLVGAETLESVRSYNQAFDSDEDTPARAREWLESLELDIPDDCILLTHELVVNAMSHTDTRCIWVVVLASPTVIRIEVSNEGRTEPHLVDRGSQAENGRGLRWVDALSDVWDLERNRATHVWFQVPLKKEKT